MWLIGSQAVQNMDVVSVTSQERLWSSVWQFQPSLSRQLFNPEVECRQSIQGGHSRSCKFWHSIDFIFEGLPLVSGFVHGAPILSSQVRTKRAQQDNMMMVTKWAPIRPQTVKIKQCRKHNGRIACVCFMHSFSERLYRLIATNSSSVLVCCFVFHVFKWSSCVFIYIMIYLWSLISLHSLTFSFFTPPFLWKSKIMNISKGKKKKIPLNAPKWYLKSFIFLISK